MDVIGFKTRDGGVHYYDYRALTNRPSSEDSAAAPERIVTNPSRRASRHDTDAGVPPREDHPHHAPARLDRIANGQTELLRLPDNHSLGNISLRTSIGTSAVVTW